MIEFYTLLALLERMALVALLGLIVTLVLYYCLSMDTDDVVPSPEELKLHPEPVPPPLVFEDEPDGDTKEKPTENVPACGCNCGVKGRE